MKDFWKEEPEIEKKLNKKKAIITASIIILIVLIAVLTSIYISYKPARKWVDKYILQKQVEQNSTATIDLETEDSSEICAYGNYIAILDNMKLNIYNQDGNEETALDIQINTPIYVSSGKYLCVAEKSGQKIYLISGKTILWENEIEGNISQIIVNKNGYVAVLISDTNYKAVVSFLKPNGEDVFKTFLKSTRVVDMSISNDNKYLAIGEMDTSGTMIQSNVKIVSVEKAKSDPTNSITYTYNADLNRVLINVKYQDKDKLVCMYDDGIDIIDNNNSVEKIFEIGDKKISFYSVELNNSSAIIEEKSSGLFTADSTVNIINSTNKKQNMYTVDEVAKEIYTSGDIIALNFGTEMHFITTSGWLKKEYLSNQEITNVVMTESIAGIIYRDKIEIIEL